jgi:hypothetical protein
LPSMTRHAAGAVDVAGIEPKHMSTGLARKSARGTHVSHMASKIYWGSS